MITRELKLLVASFRPRGDMRPYIASFAHEIFRLRPSRARLTVAMAELWAKNDSLPSPEAVCRAVRQASVDAVEIEEGAE
jgi:hypothetical protein